MVTTTITSKTAIGTTIGRIGRAQSARTDIEER
jgi:hypothetical protein